MITTKKAKSQEAHVTIDAKWGVNSRAVQDYAYITNPAQFYELHYSALKNYYVNSGMSIGEAHLRANTNLTEMCIRDSFLVTKLVISELPTAMQNYANHRNRTI